MCEAGGVDSIWQTDRLVSRTPILECMATMAALAGRTRRLRFGMNVVSLALRDPVLLAKQCATIDVLSEGRLLPAFGIGSPLGPEWVALDIDTKTRGRRTDESLEIIARLWRDESVDFAGKYYRLNGASISPKPVQPDLADVDRRLVRRRGEAHGEVRHRLAGRRRDPGRRDPHRRGDQEGPARSWTDHRRGSLRRKLPLPFRLGERPRSRPGDGGLRQAHRPRPEPAVRRGRRRHHPRSRRRIRGGRRPEVHLRPVGTATESADEDAHREVLRMSARDGEGAKPPECDCSAPSLDGARARSGRPASYQWPSEETPRLRAVR
jgi:hypothetical protein